LQHPHCSIFITTLRYAAEQDFKGDDDDDDFFDDVFAGASKKDKKKKKKNRGNDADASESTTSPTSEGSDSENPNSRRKDDPFMLGGSLRSSAVNPADINVDSIPMVTITDDDLDVFGGSKKGGKKGKKGSKKKSKASAPVAQNFSIISEEILPEGVTLDTSKKSKKKNERTKPARKDSEDMDLDDIDITTPLGEAEVIPTQKHHEVSLSHFEDTVSGKDKKKKSKKDKEVSPSAPSPSAPRRVESD
jgi:hypothetical protein